MPDSSGHNLLRTSISSVVDVGPACRHIHDATSQMAAVPMAFRSLITVVHCPMSWSVIQKMNAKFSMQENNKDQRLMKQICSLETWFVSHSSDSIFARQICEKFLPLCRLSREQWQSLLAAILVALLRMKKKLSAHCHF